MERAETGYQQRPSAHRREPRLTRGTEVPVRADQVCNLFRELAQARVNLCRQRRRSVYQIGAKDNQVFSAVTIGRRLNYAYFCEIITELW